jgi:thiamine biosynthesis lipoprotein ApbE
MTRATSPSPPTADQPGNWEVTVRQAGHGDIVAIIPVGEDAIAASGDEYSR